MSRPRFIPGSTAVFHVKNRSGIQPLSQYLAARLGVVVSWADDLLASGHVCLDGEAATTATRINLSDGPHTISVAFPDTWPRHMAATEMPLDILFEDDYIVAINKPAGVVVHPARGHLDNRTLQNGIRHRYRHMLGRSDATLGSPHRLDKETSGVILFAILRSAYVSLVDQFSKSSPHKEYFALMDGDPDFEQIRCDGPIGPDPERKGVGKVIPLAQGGKAARTDFRILERGEGWALALAVPHTGRPHQIRIHAASLGLPLAGDSDYNPNPTRLGLARQGLHAASLSFLHSTTNEIMRVDAPIAEDIKEALRVLRRERPSLQAIVPPPVGDAHP